jgi:uncharacterized membrane protein
MKKIFFFIFFALLPFFVPTPAHAEQIIYYDSTYSIENSGAVDVTEKILYDFGSQERHGIYRTIPIKRTNTDKKSFQLTAADFSVTNENGTPYTFTTTDTDGNISVRIGDANKTITGTHVYQIDYTLSGALTYFSDHDELYWNVTGNGWEIPIAVVRAHVKFPTALSSSDIKLICYTGTSGSTKQTCSTSYAGETATLQTTSSLGSGEGMTIAVSFPKNVAAVLEPKEIVETPVNPFVSIGLIVISFLWYGALPLWIIIHWLRYGRDPKPPMGETHAWFSPPKTQSGRDLTPGETGTLIDESADMQDVTATIIDLARRGYMKIVEVKKNDFTLVKLKEFSGDKNLEAHELILLQNIFEKRDRVGIKNADFIPIVAAMKSQLYSEVVMEKFFDKNPQSTRTKYYVVAGIGLFTGNIWLAIIAFIFGKNMPRKTLLGSQTAAVAKSLKNFLVSQERWMAGIAKNQLMFEKLLPYATAFGVEKIWAERFKDIAMQEPGWYQGYGSHTFSSLYLISALSHANTSVVSAATPTRSSSGFSSGFSGGFSGGGGGGGGGGSW